MSNDTPTQEVIKVLVFVGGKLNLEDHEFLDKYTETILTASSRLNSMSNFFLFLKKIDIPLHEDIIEFYKHTFMKIDADFDGIMSDEVLIDIVRRCENFGDFIKLRPDSFKKKLLEYLFDLNH